MIAGDQPDCFADSLTVAVSSRDDGTVLDKVSGIHSPETVANRQRFCKTAGVQYLDVAYQRIIYSEGATYSLICEVDKRSTTKNTDEVVADALFTDQKGVGLFLPVADCVATVVHDPVNNYLALLHMGRHSTFANLIANIIGHFESQGSVPSDLIVWMSPSAQKDSYKLDYFPDENNSAWQDYYDKKPDGYYLDMQGYNRQQFIAAGLLDTNIHVSPVDSVTNHDYFSHSAGETSGRFAVVAMMR